jgi:hypothetical protein
MMEVEEEAPAPPTTTVVDRRRQQSEAAAACSAILMMMSLQQESMTQEEETMEPKVKKTRTARRLFDCQGAYSCTMRDHLGRSNPLYGKEFPLSYLRLSRTRVQMILEDLGRLSQTSHPFFQSFRVDKFGRMGASVKAKVLLPLKSLVYGVAPHCIADYFQFSHPCQESVSDSSS